MALRHPHSSAHSGVNENGNGTIVDEIHLHIRTETPCFYVQSILAAQALIEVVVQRLCLFRARSLDEGRAIAMTHIAIESKL